MTPAHLNKLRQRLDALEPAAEPVPYPTYTPKPLDPHVRAGMLAYLNGERVRLLGQSAAVEQAMNDYLDENRR
jgi:hypothetical protein